MRTPAPDDPLADRAAPRPCAAMPFADWLMFILWLILGVALAALALSSAGAAELTARVAARSAGAPLEFNRPAFTNAAGEMLAVTRLDLLLSGFALRHADGRWFERPDWQAFLSLGEEPSGFRVGDIPAGEYDRVRFNVGVPRELNHADPAQFPAGHPLNPNRNGLHWSWQGGYIFLALEGRWHGALASGFSLHFANDWNLTTVMLPVALDLRGDAALALELDVARLLRDLSFARDGNSTHSRAGDPVAAQLAAALPPAFRAAPYRRDKLRGFPSSVSSAEASEALKNGVRATPLSEAAPLDMPARFTPYRFTMSAVFPVPDLPRDNPLTEERIALGRALFHEPRLSRDNSISCATCHDGRAAFSDTRRFSAGVEGRLGARQSMPLFNLAWKGSFFWDGRAPSLRAQALMPIQDHAEMDETLERVVAKLNRAGEKGVEENGAPRVSFAAPPDLCSPSSQPDYRALFAAAFGSSKITPEKIGLALENYLLTLTSFDSKFDRAQRGEPGFVLTEQEQRGFELFFTEYDPRRGQFGADCFHCHGGANFSNHGFANNGLDAAFTDLGRFNVTRREADRGKFSVPSLRNVAVTAPYMHDGRFATLEEAVGHYVGGVKPSATLDPNLAKHPDGGVPLSAADEAALVAFLRALTDHRHQRPVPSVTSLVP